jgi:hypothetical protein
MRNRNRIIINILGVVAPLFVILLAGFWLSGNAGRADELSGASYFADVYSERATGIFANNVKPYLNKDGRMATFSDSKCPIAQTLPKRVVEETLKSIFGERYQALNIEGAALFKGSIFQERIGVGYRINVMVDVFADFPVNKDTPASTQKEWVTSKSEKPYYLAGIGSLGGGDINQADMDLLCSFNVSAKLN